MRFADYLTLAIRSLRRSRLRSGLTIAAIVIGATGITIMLTFVTSVKNDVVNQFVQTGQIRQVQVSETPNLTYEPAGNTNGGGGPSPGTPGSTSTLTPAMEARIAALPHVTGVAAVIQGLGSQELLYLSYGGHELNYNNLSAYEPDGVIRPTVVAGRDFGRQDNANVVLVSELYANALGYKGDYSKLIGQTVELHTIAGYTGAGATLPNVLTSSTEACTPGVPPPPGTVCSNGPGSGGSNSNAIPAVDLPAKVVGVLGPAYPTTIYLPLSWAIAIADQAVPQIAAGQGQGNNGFCGPNFQPCPGSQGSRSPGQPVRVSSWQAEPASELLASRGGYGAFIVNVDSLSNVTAVATSIDHLGVSASTGIDALNQQKRKANGIGLILGGLGLIALGIAALGVMNTMVMSVLERTREIGVMRALGARRSTIRRLFTFEAAGLGFFGGLFGVAIGYGFVILANSVIVNTIKSSSLSGTSFSVPLWLVLLVIGGTTLIGFLSGLIPARRAARLDPVEALRYE